MRCKNLSTKASAKGFTKISNDELKAIFHGISEAIDAGHIAEDAAHALKEKMRSALMEFLEEQRGPRTNYGALIAKKALKKS